jgi:hypothetical protein
MLHHCKYRIAPAVQSIRQPYYDDYLMLIENGTKLISRNLGSWGNVTSRNRVHWRLGLRTGLRVHIHLLICRSFLTITADMSSQDSSSRIAFALS